MSFLKKFATKVMAGMAEGASRQAERQRDFAVRNLEERGHCFSEEQREKLERLADSSRSERMNEFASTWRQKADQAEEEYHEEEARQQIQRYQDRAEAALDSLNRVANRLEYSLNEESEQEESSTESDDAEEIELAADAVTVTVPRLDGGIYEAEIFEWFYFEGDDVSEGDILGGLEIDGRLCAVKAPVSGVVARIDFSPPVRSGSIICHINPEQN